jgi:hypothetical protein
MLKRPIPISGVLVAVMVLAGCGWTTDRPAEVDLLSVLPSAERRAAGDPAKWIRADVFVAGDDGRMSLVMEAPARTTWDIRLPLHAQLQTALTGAGRVRIGVSNGRTYLEVAQFEATRAWTPVTIDLRGLSEVKWSLFYQPLRMDWRLIINADATAAGNTIALDRPRLTKS